MSRSPIEHHLLPDNRFTLHFARNTSEHVYLRPEIRGDSRLHRVHKYQRPLRLRSTEEGVGVEWYADYYCDWWQKCHGHPEAITSPTWRQHVTTSAGRQCFSHSPFPCGRSVDFNHKSAPALERLPDFRRAGCGILSVDSTDQSGSPIAFLFD